MPYVIKRKPAQPEPEFLGTDLNIEGVRSEEELVDRWVVHVMACCNNNKTVAARVLGFDRRTLYRRLERIEARRGAACAEGPGTCC